MAKHAWTRLDHDPSHGLKYWGKPTRKCTSCGVEQERTSETWYMRVISYKWWPLVGHCKGVVKS